MEKILLGLGLSDEVLEGVINALNQAGVKIDAHTIGDNKRTKEAVMKVLMNGSCEYSVAIISQALQISSPFSYEDFDNIRTENEHTLIIPIIADSFKGTEYMRKLEAAGITGAVFEKDADMKTIAEVIKNHGRSRKLAKVYYDIEKNAKISDAVNENITIMLDEANNKQKEVFNNRAADTASFSEVKDIIAVLGLTKEAGSTMIALNLSKAIAQLGITATMIQLPNTGSDIYDSLSFAKVFSSDYISHISDIASNKMISMDVNKYQGINFIAPNPHTDLWVEDIWGNEQTYRLLLSVAGTKILDCGSYYESDGVMDVLMYCKHILVVIDASYTLTEDDFSFVKNLRRNSPDIDISFVINKCRDECMHIKELLKNEKNLTLPMVNNEVLERSGADIIVPSYGNGFEKLSELIGLGRVEINPSHAKVKKPGKKRISIDMHKRVHEKVNMTTVEIGFGGVVRGVGVTHTALMTAYLLSKKYRVAVVEQNQPYDNARAGTEHAFANIYRMINPDSYVNSNVVPRFRYKGMDFYPYCNYTQFCARFRDDYDFVIVDFGDEMADKNFFRMGKRIVVASGSDWKIHELKRYVNEVAIKNNLENSINYLIPFIPSGKLGQIRKICQAGGSMPGVYSVPMSPDWDNPPEEFEIIIADILNKINQKRRLFAGLFAK